MHACGHDCHIAMLLTATRILHDMKEELCGTVKLAFQPAEEVALGAKSMVEQGALDGVDACFAIHVWTDVKSGMVSLEPAPDGVGRRIPYHCEGKGVPRRTAGAGCGRSCCNGCHHQ